jgi:hypothetical protein
MAIDMFIIPQDARCSTCGFEWRKHFGLQCPSAGGKFVPAKPYFNSGNQEICARCHVNRGGHFCETGPELSCPKVKDANPLHNECVHGNLGYWIPQWAKQFEAEVAVAAVNTSGKAINDHVCPSCGNKRCSRTEKLCWLCGGSLHEQRI